MTSPVRTELAAVERLIKQLVRDVKAADRAVKRERSDVQRAAHPSPGWGRMSWRDTDDARDRVDHIERERAELADAESQARIASDAVALARGRSDTLRARIDAGQHDIDDAAALAHDLRDMLALADTVAGQAQEEALGAALGRHEGRGHYVTEVQRALARARAQLGLLVAHLTARGRAPAPVLVAVATLDLEVSGDVATAAWRARIAECRREVVARTEPLLPTTAYR